MVQGDAHENILKGSSKSLHREKMRTVTFVKEAKKYSSRL
jgi:hypothetical protein